MNKILLTVFTVLFSLTSLFTSATNPDEWTTYFENNQVKIEYKYQNCDYTEQFDSEYVTLKIHNLTDKSVSIEWKEQLWYDDKCINCEQDSPEKLKTVTLKAKEVVKGNCYTNNRLKIFSKFTEKLEDMPGVSKITALTKFELKNIKTK